MLTGFNFSSPGSKGNLFALLNNDESRGKFTVSLREGQFPRAAAGAHARAAS
jgi:hypothetical protein